MSQIYKSTVSMQMSLRELATGCTASGMAVEQGKSFWDPKVNYHGLQAEKAFGDRVVSEFGAAGYNSEPDYHYATRAVQTLLTQAYENYRTVEDKEKTVTINFNPPNPLWI